MINTLDTLILGFAISSRTPPLDAFFKFITHFGGLPLIAGVAVSASIFFLLYRRPYSALAVLFGSAFAWAVQFSLKLLTVRSRPIDIETLVQADGFSFPSGHTLAVAVLYLLILYYLLPLLSRSWRYVATSLTLFFIFLVSASRVYLGVHYPSDIAGAWATALALFALTVWLFPRQSVQSLRHE